MDLSRQRLSVKLVWIAVGLLMVALAAVGYTLLQSWKLEGGAAAINDMGSERMRSYRIAYLVSETLRRPDRAARTELRHEMDRMEAVLTELKRGDPSRPLSLPRDPEIVRGLAAIQRHWTEDIRPRILQVLAEPDPARRSALASALRPDIEGYVGEINSLVGALEHRNASYTNTLRDMQFGLVALAVAGTVTLIYLMFLLVVRPVETLSLGMQRMARGEFGVRLPVETRDEFGELAAGFNRMAAHLQDLYATLEGRVASKTRSLEEKNRELGILYGVATLLNAPASAESLCHAFLRKLIGTLEAQGGAVRLIDPKTRGIHLFVHEGMKEQLAREEQCIEMGECLCGAAARRDASAVERLSQREPGLEDYRCRKAGYETLGIFPIRYRRQLLGIFNLYFNAARTVTPEEQRMLEALGDHLGVALENQRLISSVKEMAAAEERTLLAQELHDSIAQSLAFLNIEAQMLEDALEQAQTREARDVLAQIRVGIQRSYEDVRELLVHFRTRIKTEDLGLTIRTALEHFEQQTGVKTSFVESGSAVPLAPERHLQVLHILQEALSNVRKHAEAAHVAVEVQRGRTYRFVLRDDGKGFDPAVMGDKGEGHVGVSIMQERAQRIGGELTIDSRPGAGTVVTLLLPVAQADAVAA